MEAEASARVVPLQAPHNQYEGGGGAAGLQRSEQLPFTVGSRVAGRFHIKALLGVGGTSCLYQAWDEYAASDGTADAYVAIKVPRRRAEHDCGTDLIFREVAVARRVSSRRGLVDIFDLHQHHGRFFLTQELVRGESLRSRLDRAGGHGLQYKSCIAIGRELALAVAGMHEAGVVHADIKPSNVLLTQDGQLRLIDLATARPVSAMPGMAEPPFHGFSPAYASRQTLNDEPADPSDDVYSLACVLYEQLAGHHPFGGHSAQEAEAAGLTPPRPRELGWAQWRVLRQGLAFDAKRRPRDIRYFWRRFARARLYAGVLSLGAGLLIVGALTLLAPVDDLTASEDAVHPDSVQSVGKEGSLGS